MRLLLFIHSLSSGGAERVLTNLANAWAERGWPLSFVTMASRDADFYRLHPSIERFCLDLAHDGANPVEAALSNARRIAALRRILRHSKPDIAIGFMTVANILLTAAAMRMPHVVTVGAERTHPPTSPVGAPWEALRRWSYRRLDAVVAQTERTAAWLTENTRAAKVHVIPNPVLWPMEQLSPVVAPDSVGSPARRRMLSVGRLVPQKGFDLLIRAFAICAHRFPQWELVIVGEGPARDELQALVAAFGIADRAFLPGQAGNIGAWYERAHAYVLSSRFEGMPNVLLEAMSHGLPVVSFDCETGPDEIVRHGVDGLLVPPQDTMALAEAMAMLMGDDDLRQQLGTRAVETRLRFALPTIDAQWSSLLVRLHAARASR